MGRDPFVLGLVREDYLASLASLDFLDILAYWSFFRIKSLKTPIITYICGIYKFRYAKNAFSVALKM